MVVKLLVVHNPHGYSYFQAEMERANMEVMSSFAETELRPLELHVLPCKLTPCLVWYSADNSCCKL